MKLYGDGWYADRQDAVDCLAFVEARGARPVGIIESRFGSWGLLYWSSNELFPNHAVDSSHSAIAAVAGLVGMKEAP